MNTVTVLMITAKMASPGLLTTKVFWNKHDGIIISVHDVTNKILSCDSNYIVDVVMWPKFGNCSISMREIIMTSSPTFSEVRREKLVGSFFALPPSWIGLKHQNEIHVVYFNNHSFSISSACLPACLPARVIL